MKLIQSGICSQSQEYHRIELRTERSRLDAFVAQAIDYVLVPLYLGNRFLQSDSWFGINPDQTSLEKAIRILEMKRISYEVQSEENFKIQAVLTPFKKSYNILIRSEFEK
eukprot:TRINITY_DN2167_c0_g2_i2.p1 TRINITY_DN2167_c0_g2~~TRINITY_DN2167_c0_g2_i2.p1  ORF type:complete len:110 (-),score=7.86 TRINITY_DN2167_c0_g2_i2:112-441(-)